MPTQQRRNRLRGKNAERAVAKILGGRRMGLFGKEDVEMEHFSVEVKSRVSFIGKKWMAQATTNNPMPKEKMPIVVVHTKSCKHDDDLVIMRLTDLKDIMEL